MRTPRVMQLSCSLILALAGAISAQTWTGQGANPRWDYSTGLPFNFYTNWSGNLLPSNSANVVFANGFGSGNPDLNGNRRVNSLTVNAFGNFTLLGQPYTLTITSGSLVRNGGSLGVHTIACNVVIEGGANWQIDGPEANGHLRVSGTVSDGAGSLTLTKTAAGTLILSNTNTYDGGTTVSVGKLLVDNTAGSGTGTGMVTVSPAAILGGRGTVGAVAVSSGGIVAPGTLDLPAAQFTVSGGLSLADGSVLRFDLGTTSDKLRVSGGTYAHAGSVAVHIAQSGGLAADQTYTVVDFTGAVPSSIDAADFTLADTVIAGQFVLAGSTVEFHTFTTPTDLAATVQSASQIDLDWSDNPVSGITYSIYRGISPGFVADLSSRIAANVAASAYSDTSVDDNITYYYKVVATDAYGNASAASVEASASTPAAKDILYVKAGAPGGGDGTSWSTPFNSLQNALAAASDLDEIWVSGGTFLPGGARTSSFVLKNGVRIYGGFPGVPGQENNFTVRDLVASETVLSADIPGANCYHVVLASGVGSTTIVDGVTIRDGQANGAPGDGTNRGGGVYISGASPVFVNCTFRNNSALVGGGVLKEGGGSPSFVNCVFYANAATTFYGGALFSSGGTATLVNCTLGANSGPQAGAVYTSSATTLLTNCVVWGNTSGSGAHIRHAGSFSTSITSSCIEGGYAGAGNISVDPKFVDLAGGNLRLLASSNCVESGNTGALPADVSDTDGDGDEAEPIPLDRDGAARVIGVAVDMGAYEVPAPDVPPAAPTVLTAALLTGTQVALDWADNAEPDLVGYNVYRATTPAVPLTPAARVASSLAASAHVDTVVDDGTTYYYVVTALDAAGGESLASLAAPLATRPGAPAGLAAVGVSPTQIDVDWADNPEPDIAGYHVYRSIVPGFTPAPANQVATGVAVSNYSDTGLEDGRTYYYRVVAVDGAGNESAQSAQASATTSNLPGTRLYVAEAATLGGNGTSWALAFRDLQLALAAAGPGDEIWVAVGTYKPGAGRATAFQLKTGVAIYGGFPGTPGQEGDSSVRNPGVHVSLLSGDIGNVGVVGDNSYHVVTGHGVGNTAVLDGFTIAYGLASGAPNPNQENVGAGIFVAAGGSPVIRNCVFHSNGALVGGGACNLNSSPRYENCVFRNNATGSGGNSGGGMYNEHSGLTVLNCAFYANTSGQGGGVYNGSNTASARYINCLFSGNSAAAGGAVANESLAGNTTAAYINCTFSRNNASVGGGFFNKYIGAAPVVTNCIFWNNTNGQIVNSNGSAGGPVTYTCIEGGYPGTGNISSDPQFEDADGADNIVGTLDDDLRVLAGSPTIDTGNAAVIPPDVLLDLAGTPRVLGDAVDMGAYETIPLFRFDYDRDGDIDNADFATFAGCRSGPSIAHDQSADCFEADADGDDDVDHDDFGEFQRCYSGSGRAAPADCAVIAS